MTRLLTLEQVRKAGRTAELTSGSRQYEWWDGVVDVVCACCGCGVGQYQDTDLKRGHVPRDGWHHLPGCDCEFCEEGVDALMAEGYADMSASNLEFAESALAAQREVLLDPEVTP